MHNILRAFVTATNLLIDANDSQIDERGRTKAVSTVWVELPTMSADVIHVAEQLLEDPTLAAGEPCLKEAQWLKAVIDEVATNTEAAVQSTEDSWASLARYTAWLAFCLNQSAAYAEDPDYGRAGFQLIRDQIAGADDFERSVLETAITAASAHIESSGSLTSKAIVATYEELLCGSS